MPEANSNEIDAAEVRQQAASLAAHLRRSGVEWLPVPDASRVDSIREQLRVEDDAAEPVAAPAPSSLKSSNADAKKQSARPASDSAALFSLSADDDKAVYPGERLDEASRVERLAAMSNQVDSCTRCELLAECRTKTVFGEGSPTPRFAFFGEGPGRDEDLSGRPFVGKAGQLLTKMIEACKLAREDVYIMNTVKCRPPNNRNPEPAEVQNCREYFEGQLSILRPEYIVCLGLVSTKALFPNTPSVGRMRGRLHRYFESKVLVTYHPSYLLRTPAAKKAAWDDLQLMLRDAGLL